MLMTINVLQKRMEVKSQRTAVPLSSNSAGRFNVEMNEAAN
jgi:hypothetical protein